MKLNEVKFLPKGNAVAHVYTKATGMAIVGEMMVAAAGNGGEPTPPTPVAGEFGELQIYRSAEVPNYNFNAVMQCTGYMDDTKKYEFTTDYSGETLFSLIMVVDPNDNTKLIMDSNNDSQYVGELNLGETGDTLPCTITDLTTWEQTTGDATTYRVMN